MTNEELGRIAIRAAIVDSLSDDTCDVIMITQELNGFDMRAAIKAVCAALAAEQDQVVAEKDREIAALREGLEWALREGGWRLIYYADSVAPGVIDADQPTVLSSAKLRELWAKEAQV